MRKDDIVHRTRGEIVFEKEGIVIPITCLCDGKPFPASSQA